MILWPILIWYLTGFIAWIASSYFFGLVTVGDVLFAMMCGATGPMLPILIGLWYLTVKTEELKKYVIWKRKS